MRDLLEGIGAYLAVKGVGSYTADPTVVPAAGSTAITIKLFPSAPDRVVMLNVVSQGDDPSMPLGKFMLQVRSRGNPNDPMDVEDVVDAAFNALHGVQNLVCGSVTVIQLERRVSVPMGMDAASKRWGRLDQFYGDLAFSPTNLRPEGGFW